MYDRTPASQLYPSIRASIFPPLKDTHMTCHCSLCRPEMTTEDATIKIEALVFQWMMGFQRKKKHKAAINHQVQDRHIYLKASKTRISHTHKKNLNDQISGLSRHKERKEVCKGTPGLGISVACECFPNGHHFRRGYERSVKSCFPTSD